MPAITPKNASKASPEAQQAFVYEIQPQLARMLESARQDMTKLMGKIVHGKWPDKRTEYAVMRHKPLSMDDKSFRNDLYTAYTEYEGRHKMGSTPKFAHRPMLEPDGLNARKVQAGEGFMLYWIDAGANHSKFYEGIALPNDDGTWRAMFRWGALTDSGFTGRIDGPKYDAKFAHLSQSDAKRALATKYMAKTRKGYVDAWKHKGLPKGQYPVGLKRDVGFGWGVQETAFCIPALRQIQELLREAQGSLGLAQFIDASGTLDFAANVAKRQLASADSTMAKKIIDNIAHMQGRALTLLEGGYDSGAIRNWKVALSRLISYIDKQLSVCHGKMAAAAKKPTYKNVSLKEGLDGSGKKNFVLQAKKTNVSGKVEQISETFKTEAEAKNWLKHSMPGAKLASAKMGETMNRRSRVQMLLPRAIRSKIPKLYSGEDNPDPIAWVKLFNAYGRGTWLITEFDGRDRMFGLADLGTPELGYMSLSEMEGLQKMPGVQQIERDTSFRPAPLSEAAKKEGVRWSPSREASKRRRAEFNPEDIGAIKPPSGDPDEMRIVQDTDQRWFSEVEDLYPSGKQTPWDGQGQAPESYERTMRLAAKLQCDGKKGCTDAVAYIDTSGHVYCANHAPAKNDRNRRARKLKPAEIKKLEAGNTIRYAARKLAIRVIASQENPAAVNKLAARWVAASVDTKSVAQRVFKSFMQEYGGKLSEPVRLNKQPRGDVFGWSVNDTSLGGGNMIIPALVEREFQWDGKTRRYRHKEDPSILYAQATQGMGLPNSRLVFSVGRRGL